VFTVESLTEQIQQLDRKTLLEMAQHARGAAKLDADKTVAQAIVALTEKR
jgi:UDP-N-acetylglucosamine--N-acetylmuramyl-(pentapeptide) pyrophosphoryl-undecaprenol N-acetylglucosamine transferase